MNRRGFSQIKLLFVIAIIALGFLSVVVASQGMLGEIQLDSGSSPIQGTVFSFKQDP